jgi:hypothetical protein
MYYLYGPPKGLVYNPKPLVVTNNMKEHYNLLLNCATFCFRYKAPERIKMPKRGVNWAFLKFIARIKSY